MATSYSLKHWGYLISTTSLSLLYLLLNFLQHLACGFLLSWFLNLLVLVPQARLSCLRLFMTLLTRSDFSILFQHEKKASQNLLFIETLGKSKILQDCDSVAFFCIIINLSSQILVQNTIFIFITLYLIKKNYWYRVTQLKIVLKIICKKKT